MTHSPDEPSSPRTAWPLLRGLTGWKMGDLWPDLVAGATLAAISIPEQMATARLAGFPPQAGFVALIAGVIGFAAFGDSRRLSVGADSTIAPIFAGSLAALGIGSAHYLGAASTLALSVGVLLAVAGVLRFGFIADLLSIPVTTGFLAGIAGHIVVSQAPEALGLHATHGPLFEQAQSLGERLGSANPWTVGISLGVLAIMLLGERISARIPGALIGVAAAGAATVLFGLEAHGVTTIGELSGPVFQIVPLSAGLADFRTIAPLALVITLIIMVQTAATTRSYPLGHDPDVNRDFVGVGAANLVAGAAGVFAVDASPPCTAIVAEAGGTSQLTSLLTAALALALLLFGGGIIAHIPRAALAGILFFVAFRIVRTHVIAEVWRRSRAEFLLIVVTALAMLALPIQQGVSVGIILSVLHGVWTTTRSRAVELKRIPGTSIWWPPTPGVAEEDAPGVKVIALQAPLSFLNAYNFRAEIERAIEGASLRFVVIEANALVEIDYTGAAMLQDLIGRLRGRGIDVALARLESVRAQQSFARLGLTDLIGRDRIFHSVQEAIDALVRRPASSSPS